MTYLLDTNVVSELRRVRTGKAHPHVAAWARTVTTGDLFVSAITIQEIEIGVFLMERKDPVQGDLLRVWLEDRILPTFAGRILPVDLHVARVSARLHVPNPPPYRDGLIAATAITHGMSVVTRNIGDFAGTGVSLVNPWEGFTQG